ncbi:MAG: aminoacyl-tRNA deacylase [Acidiferrobacterales bacterium]
MAISICLKDYLDSSGVHYDVLAHRHTRTSAQTAREAHIPGKQLAKSVILQDDAGYFIVVIPSTHRVDLGSLHHKLHRQVGLAVENDLKNLFSDCALGAAPPVGEAYGIPAYIDVSLDDESDVYFEAGDHEALVHMSGRDFRELTRGAQHGRFSHHV